MASSTLVSSAFNPQNALSSRQSSRQTRTNPSRVSRTAGRSSFAFGHPLTAGAGETASSPGGTSGPYGFYPALTHFTDSITALPREFRRHNSLLKEVDAKSWALEENLLQWLQVATDADPPSGAVNGSASDAGGSARDDGLQKVRRKANGSSLPFFFFFFFYFFFFFFFSTATDIFAFGGGSRIRRLPKPLKAETDDFFLIVCDIRCRIS